jgi:SNF2 family DNA or RNA helicase
VKILVGLTPQKTELTLDFDYSPQIIARVKTIFGRYFNGETRKWHVPVASFEEIIGEFGCMIELVADIGDIFEAIDRIGPTIGTIDANVLDVMKLQPYDYQLIGGTAFLPTVQCGILADVPGLGKTIQTFLGFASLYVRDEISKCLVFCKKSLKTQWLVELERFTPFTGIKIYGDAKKREKLYEEAAKPEYQFIFINYEFLQHDAKYIKKRQAKGARGFEDFDFIRTLASSCQLIVLDEAQKIKSSKSQVHKNIVKLDAPYKWALTGTPIENSPMDLYNICRFVNPYIFGPNPVPFKNRYFTGYYKDKVNIQMLKDLRLRIAPYMLRRTYESVDKAFPHLKPPESVWVDMTDEQAKLHDDLKDIMQDLLEGMPNTDVPDGASALGTFGLMLQVADNPYLLYHSESQLGQQLFKKMWPKLQSWRDIECPKMEWIHDFLEERVEVDPNAKTIIFTRSDDMASVIKESLLDIYSDKEIVVYEGGLSESQQDAIKTAFWDYAKVLVATDAGSEGLNLQCADVEINFDLPYNPARLAQRIGRIKRDGSKFASVRVINLISKNSIDERVLKIIYSKQSIIDEVVEGNSTDTRLTKSLLSQLIA